MTEDKTSGPQKIDKGLVEKTKPKDSDVFIWDTLTRGFGLKVTPASKKVFIFQYRLRRSLSRLTIGEYGKAWGEDGRPLTADRARRQAEIYRGQVNAGADPKTAITDSKKNITIAQLCDDYLKDAPHIILKGKKRPKKESTLKTDKVCIESHIKPLLGKRRVRDIAKEDVEKFQRDIAAGKTAKDSKDKDGKRSIVKGGIGAAGRSTALLGTLFTYAISEKCCKKNPVRGVEIHAPESRERKLSPAELKSIGEALNAFEGSHPQAVAVLRLLILTGARKSEILALKWDWVDIEARALLLPDSKTGKKTIHLPAPALKVINKVKKVEGSPFVFPAMRGDGHYVGLPKVWRDIRDKAKLPDLRRHDLRHGFASMAVAGGDSLYLVGKVLGHKQAKTTEKYAHLPDDPVRAVANRAASKMDAALRGKKGKVVRMRKK